MPTGTFLRTKKHCDNISKALKGKKLSKKHIKSIVDSHKGKNLGEDSPRWKGDKVGVGALHSWVVRRKGKPIKCQFCGELPKKAFPKRIQWANKDHKYRRKLNDFIGLCVSCHRNYDYKNHLSNIGSKWGSIPNKTETG